jgi:predicted O-methyltransferase YrrM
LLKPALVEDAIKFAESTGFEESCLHEVGELLHVLAGHIQGGRIAEIGTGCGVGTAWLASATTRDIYTIDHDRDRAIGIKDLFVGQLNVHPIVGDWEQILHEGPFQLVFVDAKPAKLDGIDQIVNATEIGGLIVLDDLTPIEFWPDEWKGQPDPIRGTWLHHSQLASVELRTSQRAAALLARRVL